MQRGKKMVVAHAGAELESRYQYFSTNLFYVDDDYDYDVIYVIDVIACDVVDGNCSIYHVYFIFHRMNND